MTHESGASQDIADPRALRLERAHRLGRQFRVQVTFDDAGWLQNEVELVFTKAYDDTIWPVKVRVGREASPSSPGQCRLFAGSGRPTTRAVRHRRLVM